MGMVTTHSPDSVCFTNSSIRCRTSSTDAQPASEGKIFFNPSRSKCACPSIIPGITAAPAASRIAVSVSALWKTSSSDPTAKIWPFLSESARWIELLLSHVIILAFLIRSSAFAKLCPKLSIPAGISLTSVISSTCENTLIHDLYALG